MSAIGIDEFGPWIDSTGSGVAGVDGTGPWVDDAVSSEEAGVDGTGIFITVVTEAYPNDLGDEMYEELRPLWEAYGDPGDHLWIYTHGLTLMLKPVDDISKDGPNGEPGWSQIFDLSRAKTEWLPWMGQLVGYPVPTRPTGQSLEEYDTTQRERIVTRSSWRRATAEILKDIALDHLAPGTPRSRVIVQERVAGDPWRIAVYVYTADIITSAAELEKAVRRQKLAELLMTVGFLDGSQTYLLLKASNATYAIMKPKFTDYAEVKINPGKP
jgi:hypothetical protein